MKELTSSIYPNQQTFFLKAKDKCPDQHYVKACSMQQFLENFQKRRLHETPKNYFFDNGEVEKALIKVQTIQTKSCHAYSCFGIPSDLKIGGIRSGPSSSSNDFVLGKYTCKYRKTCNASNSVENEEGVRSKQRKSTKVQFKYQHKHKSSTGYSYEKLQSQNLFVKAKLNQLLEDLKNLNPPPRKSEEKPPIVFHLDNDHISLLALPKDCQEPAQKIEKSTSAHLTVTKEEIALPLGLHPDLQPHLPLPLSDLSNFEETDQFSAEKNATSAENSIGFCEAVFGKLGIKLPSSVRVEKREVDVRM